MSKTQRQKKSSRPARRPDDQKPADNPDTELTPQELGRVSGGGSLEGGHAT